MIRSTTWLGLLVLAAAPVRAEEPAALDFRDGDRVVLIGGTFIEREPSYGYLETAWTAAHPDRNVIFRNLGWSGDTVTGISRARFGPPEEGFQHLREHVLALKPTVLIVNYGANESFAGEAGLPAFRSGLSRLLDALGESQGRVVLLSPPRQEDLGPPLPDPERHNRELALYRDALRDIARERGLAFVDLLATGFPDGTKTSPPHAATNDGITLNEYGYWLLPNVLGTGAKATRPSWQVAIGPPGVDTLSFGTRISDLTTSADGVRFRAMDARLPRPPAPRDTPITLAPADRVLKVRGLRPGLYALSVDGVELARGSAGEWADGLGLTAGPEIDQVEALRRAIVKKNLLHFHRWRPQNETYLFGFRKHEQGQNAREVPLFDPLVAEQEAIIARLKVPVPHIYELKPVAEAAR
jgi:lysophospholipase L1-like esterase